MKLTLTNEIKIEALQHILSVIERNCTYRNPKFDEALRQGRSVRGISKQIVLSNRIENGLTVPVGLLSGLLAEYPDSEVIDQRGSAPVQIPFNGVLRSYQANFVGDAYDATSRGTTGGVMVAATGAGKTVCGIALASKLSQRCLILVKSKDLAEQWCGAIRRFTGLEGGQIGGGLDSEGEQFTVGLVQTLVKRDLSALEYGLVIADEVHNAPACQFFQVVTGINACYKFGLSATPQRRDNLEFMIHAAVGPIVAEVKAEQLGDKVLPVEIHPVGCPFDAEVADWTGFINVLANDDSRNRLLVRIAQKQIKPAIILTATVKHAEVLTTLTAEAGMKPLLIHGQLSTRTRSERMQRAPQASLIIGTAQLLSEGIDWPHLTVLIFAAPMSAVIDKADPAATKLIQSIGRCRRPHPGKDKALVIDLVDRCGFGISAWRKRAHVYRLQGFKVAA